MSQDLLAFEPIPMRIECYRPQAAQEAEEMGSLNGSIIQGKGNLAGIIGELMVQDYTGGVRAKPWSPDYDLVLTQHDDSKVDVKTLQTSLTTIDPHFVAAIPNWNLTQQCDSYVFCRVNLQKIGWILGWIPRKQFHEQRVLHVKDSVDADNPNGYRDDTWTVSLASLKPIRYYRRHDR